MNKAKIAQHAPKVTPYLLHLFRDHHSEGNLGQELINLFKKWCNFKECRSIFIDTFIPFILEIIELYYRNTPNQENKGTMLSLKDRLANLEEESKSMKAPLNLGQANIEPQSSKN